MWKRRAGRWSRAFVAPLTFARVVVATGAAIGVGTRLPWLGKPMVLVEAAAVAVVYLVVLVVLGELGKSDLAVLKRAAGRKAPPAG